jgi:mono/diheme cytochrome c family protein
MQPKWFAWIIPLLALLALLSWIPLALIYYARVTHSPIPRISIIPDMDNQQRFKAQQTNPLFADDRAMRPPVAGAVAEDLPQSDDFFERGISTGQWATVLPPQVPVTPELLQRGQQRFNIYCAICHGQAGDGDGMVDHMGDQLAEGTWVPPSSYHSDLVRSRPVGHLFNTITNGIRAMPAYGTQIPPADRWAIVTYIRALQRSRDARLSDVPPDQRAVLQAQASAEAATATPGAGGTSTGVGVQPPSPPAKGAKPGAAQGGS